MSETLPLWRICPTCPPDDNSWGPDSFAPSGRCWACVAQPRKPCTKCGAKVRTLGYVEHPVCQSCRRKLNPKRERPACRTPSLRGVWTRVRRAA